MAGEDDWASLRRTNKEDDDWSSLKRPADKNDVDWGTLKHPVASKPIEKTKEQKIKEVMNKWNLIRFTPGGETIRDAVFPSIAKGIPVVGNFVPQTDELSSFEKEHPNWSKGLNAAGTIASILPLAAGAAARSGAGFISQWAGQTSVAAPLNVADTLAKKGKETTDKDIKNSMIMGGASSLVPAAVTKLIGQAAKSSFPYDKLPDYLKALKGRDGPMFGPARPYTPSPANAPGPPPSWVHPGAMAANARVVMPGPISSAPPPPGMIPNPTSAVPGSAIPGAGGALATGLGGVLGGAFHGGMGIPLGAAGGMVAGKMGSEALKMLSHTRLGELVQQGAHSPTTQDILRALAAMTGKELSPKLADF